MNKADELVQCPYEKSHMILESRLQCHLVKCQKVHPDANLVPCPFNTTHTIPEAELNCHMKYLCSDRKKLDTFIYSTKESKPLIPVTKIEAESKENWDNENSSTYDPALNCAAAPVLLHLQGATPSERKAFRAKERIRFQAVAGGTQYKPTEASRAAEKSCRLPHTKPTTALYEKENKPLNMNLNNEKNLENDIEKLTSKLEGLKSSGKGETDDGFQLPKYARGRGRGRFQKK